MQERASSARRIATPTCMMEAPIMRLIWGVRVRADCSYPCYAWPVSFQPSVAGRLGRPHLVLCVYIYIYAHPPPQPRHAEMQLLSHRSRNPKNPKTQKPKTPKVKKSQIQKSKNPKVQTFLQDSVDVKSVGFLDFRFCFRFLDVCILDP